MIVKQRMHYFEHNLNWLGHANRTVLMEKFGISGAQATNDIRAYLKLRDGAKLSVIHYSPQTRRYNTEFEFYPLWDHPVPGITPNLEESFASFEFLPMPLVAPRDLRREAAILSRACVQHWTVMIRSVGSRGMESHTIQPHTLAWDGVRLECRAYCLLWKEFRNFTVGWIVGMQQSFDDFPWHGKPDDELWNQTTTLSYKLNPDQTDLEGLCREYGMQAEEIRKQPIKSLWEQSVLQHLGFQPMKSPFKSK